MIRRPPRSTRTDTLFPYTTLFRSHIAPMNLRSNLIQIYSMPVSTKMRNDVHITESISAFDHINRAANINNFNLVRLISVFLGHRTRRIRIDIDLQPERSEEQTSELQSQMRSSYAVFSLKKTN